MDRCSVAENVIDVPCLHSSAHHPNSFLVAVVRGCLKGGGVFAVKSDQVKS